MSSVVISGDTSGAITLSAPAVAGTNTATLPAATGTVMVSGNMPAFSAYLSSSQSISGNTWTKIQCNTKEFDTNSNYDNATNYRFTPTVAGYYQIVVGFGQNVTGGTLSLMAIYKNGSAYKYGTAVTTFSGSVNMTCLVFMNGSTDYVEAYGFISGASGFQFNGGQANTYFQAAMIRTA